MKHIVLLGDSIFDNQPYVAQGDAVIDQLRGLLSESDSTQLLAVDGDVIDNVYDQLAGVPANASHLFLSVGGNDALGVSSVLAQTSTSVANSMQLFTEIITAFEERYQKLLQRIISTFPAPLCVCTIHDAVPGLPQEAHTALRLFNEAILRCAAASSLSVIDLRVICCDPADYSPISPIEPSKQGARKICQRIIAVATHATDLTKQARQSLIFT